MVAYLILPVPLHKHIYTILLEDEIAVENFSIYRYHKQFIWSRARSNSTGQCQLPGCGVNHSGVSV